MSVPSRDLIDSMDPSTASMVPRMRTVGGVCANAAVATAETMASEAINEANFGMVSSQVILSVRKHLTLCGIPCVLRTALASHRRRQAVAADADAVGLERTVRQLLHEGDHLGAGLEVRLVGGDVGDDRCLRRNQDFLLAVLVLDVQGVAVVTDHGLFHGRIGHAAVGLEIIGPRALAGAAHGFRKNMAPAPLF